MGSVKPVSGIYKISNLVNGKIYVGSAVDLSSREKNHINTLRSCTHHNRYLQNSFNKHGSSAFVFSVLEFVEDVNTLIERERFYIDTLKPEYNIAQVAGSNLGVKFTDESKVNVSKGVIKALSDPVVKERVTASGRERFSNPQVQEAMQRANRTYDDTEVVMLVEGVGNTFVEFRKVGGRRVVVWFCCHGTECSARVDFVIKDPTIAGGCKQCKSDRIKYSLSFPESRAKRSALAKKQFSDPNQRKLSSAIKKEQFQDEAFREAHKQGCIKRWSSEEARRVQSETLKARINSDEVLKEVYAANARNATSSFKKKNPERAEETFAFISDQKKAYWSDPVKRELKSKAMLSRSEEDRKFSILKTRDSLFKNKEFLMRQSELNEGKDVIQRQVKDFIKSLGFSPVFSHAKSELGVVECDIAIPEKCLGFEINGEVWHSDSLGRKSKDAKLQCCEAFEKQGLRVFHIEHFEWKNQRSICESYIRSLLGVSLRKVYARKCSIGFPSRAEQKSFYTANHFLGYTSAKLCIGLLYEGSWVSMLSLGRSNRSKHSVTVNRFATTLNTNCVGGFSKLMSYVPLDLKQDLHTFIDLSKFSGVSYLKTGWVFVERLPVDYRVYYKGVVYNKSIWQKARIKERFPDRDFGSLTEFQMEDLVGAFRIWDCGKLKLRYIGVD